MESKHYSGFMSLPKNLDLKYDVSFKGEDYRIDSKARYTKFNGYPKGIEGKITINKIDGQKEINKWSPTLNSPFNTKKVKKDNLTYITKICGPQGHEEMENISFTADSFETFYSRVKEVANKNEALYPERDMAEALLKKAWKYYDEIYHKFILDE